ncbi:TetR/AcrR family transcriptional regulator [Actinomadura rugatobispora]|uniref:TetR/AcrR family transcriptional regulator n=1 Tax=Actinomadura rugatobispora TaxID=1994 RepID=A0ABW1AB29_9ACTN|nr:TetR/AcrR family transcriptional regulator [Actinomadura rugatobispora]
MGASRDPEGRRRAIIEAAGQLLAEVGAGRLTHRLVAERAGVPLGATTYYFSSLEDLVAQTVEYVGERAAQDLRMLGERLAHGGDVAATLAEVFAEYSRETRQAVLVAEMYLAAAYRPELRPVARRWFDEMAGLLAGYVPRPVAVAVTTYLDGMWIRVMLHEEPPDRDALAASLRALLALEA